MKESDKKKDSKKDDVTYNICKRHDITQLSVTRNKQSKSINKKDMMTISKSAMIGKL